MPFAKQPTHRDDVGVASSMMTFGAGLRLRLSQAGNQAGALVETGKQRKGAAGMAMSTGRRRAWPATGVSVSRVWGPARQA